MAATSVAVWLGVLSAERDRLGSASLHAGAMGRDAMMVMMTMMMKMMLMVLLMMMMMLMIFMDEFDKWVPTSGMGSSPSRPVSPPHSNYVLLLLCLLFPPPQLFDWGSCLLIIIASVLRRSKRNEQRWRWGWGDIVFGDCHSWWEWGRANQERPTCILASFSFVVRANSSLGS